MQILYLILLTIFCIEILPGACASTQSSEMFQSADRLMSSGKNLDAAQIYWKLLQTDSHCTACRYRLVEAYKRAHRLDYAIPTMYEIARMSPNDINAWLQLHELYVLQDEDPNGIYWVVMQCKTRFPNNPKTQVMKARFPAVYAGYDPVRQRDAFLNSPPPKKIVMWVNGKQANQMDLNNQQQLLRLARQGKTKEVVALLKESSQRHPDSPEDYKALESYYLRHGKLEDVIATRKTIMQKFPRSTTNTDKEFTAYLDEEVPKIRESERVRQSNTAWHWDIERMPLKVYISSSPPNGADWTPEKAKRAADLQAKMRPLVEPCLNAWKDASNGIIRFIFVSYPKDADITIEWTNDKNKLHHSFAAGEAGFKMDGNQIVQRTIYVLAYDDNFREISNDSFVVTCMHELGHALGLDHSSKPDDMMYPSSTASTISANDQARIRALYRN